MWNALKLLIGSRKFLVFVATLVVAGLAKLGANVEVELVVGVLATGVSLILGIALEDAAAKKAGLSPVQYDANGNKVTWDANGKRIP